MALENTIQLFYSIPFCFFLSVYLNPQIETQIIAATSQTYTQKKRGEPKTKEQTNQNRAQRFQHLFSFY